MKFEIDRNSWHYKLNTKGISSAQKQYLEETYTDFCSYWRLTIHNLLLVAIGISLILAMFGFPIYFAISDPVMAAVFVTLLALAILINYLFHLATKSLVKFFEQKRYKKELKQRKEPRESLLKQKFYSWKNKFCARISYK